MGLTNFFQKLRKNTPIKEYAETLSQPFTLRLKEEEMRWVVKKAKETCNSRNNTIRWCIQEQMKKDITLITK